MPISGLVLSLTQDARIDTVLAELALDSRLRVGEPNGYRLPLVSDTPSPEADRAVWDSLSARADVLHIDVAFIHFDDEDAQESERP